MIDSISIVLLAIGLAMDCFAVTISFGAAMRSMQLRDAFKIAFLFGFFQLIALDDAVFDFDLFEIFFQLARE